MRLNTKVSTLVFPEKGRPNGTYQMLKQPIGYNVHSFPLPSTWKSYVIWSCQRFWLLGHILQYKNVNDTRKNKVILVSWDIKGKPQLKRTKKMPCSQNLVEAIIFCFVFLVRGTKMFYPKNTGRALVCKTFVLQTNRSGKENNLEINGLSYPNLHSKDLILVWAASDSSSHWCQTPKHTPICELFTGLRVGWKVGWGNSGWGYSDSPRQFWLGIVLSLALLKELSDFFSGEEWKCTNTIFTGKPSSTLISHSWLLQMSDRLWLRASTWQWQQQLLSTGFFNWPFPLQIWKEMNQN